jgi:amino acid transporter
MDPGSQKQHGVHYKQELDRTLHVLGNVMITISGVAPTASVFIIAPIAYFVAGTGAFLAFVAAAVIGVGMAFSYAEVGTAYPVTGGEPPIVARILGRPLGFATLAYMLVSVVLIPSSIALGAGQYLAVIWPGQNPNLVGAVIMLAVGGLAILEIRTNAIVQGILLAIELIAVGTIVVLGLVHIQQPVSVLFSPVTYGADGKQMAVALGTVMTASAIAIFAYNGYGSAVCFAEETKGARRNIARAVLWTLALTVVLELLPVTLAILGAPSLKGLLTAPTPMSYILTSLGGETVNTVVSLMVFVAIFNGCLAIVVTMCRIIYGSGRDRTWPEPISGWLAKVHPKYKSPWVAALTMAVFGAVLTATSDVAVVVTWTGIVLVFTYALIALSAIVVRLQKRDLPPHYRMPLWPLWPVIGLGGVVYVLTQQNLRDVLLVLGIGLVSEIYYFAYIHPRRTTRWVLLEAPVEAGEEGAATASGIAPAAAEASDA